MVGYKLFIPAAVTALVLFMCTPALSQTWVKKFGSSYVLGNGLAVSPLNENTIYGATTSVNAQLEISRDRGNTWSFYGNPVVPHIGTGTNVIKSIAINPLDTSQIVLGIENTAGVDGIVRSTNGGSTWVQTWAGSFSFYGKPVEFKPAHPDTIYTMGNDTLWRSTDFGGTWDTIRRTTGLFSAWCDAEIRPDSANIIYLGDASSGIWKTTDYGLTWKKVYATTGEIPSIAIDPFDPRVAYATNWGGSTAVLKSTNGGESWHAIGAPGGNSGWWITCSAVSRGYVYYGVYAGTPNGIFVSADSGTSWRSFSSGFDSPAYFNYGLLALDTLTVIANQMNGVWKLVYPSSLRIVSPNGDEHWHGGGLYQIQWEDTNLISMRLDFTTDNGSSWNLLADSLPPSQTTYDWTTPAVISNECRVRIADAIDRRPQATRDQSDTTFTIFLDTLTLFSPVGGEIWDVGSAHSIVWVANNLAQVSLDYSTDSGATWNHIAQVPAPANGYVWTVPEPASAHCLVRVRDVTDTTISRTSPGVFSIILTTHFTAMLHLKDHGNTEDSLRFGALAGATAGTDPSFGELALGPAPPAGTFDVRWMLGDANETRVNIQDTLSPDNVSNVFTGRLQPGPGGFPFTVSWRPESLRVGVCILRDPLTHGSRFNANMRRDSTAVASDSSFEILECAGEQLSYQGGGSWALLSVPLQVGDRRKSTLFPFTLSNAFTYQTSYVRSDTLNPGVGYWLKLNSAAIVGCPQTLDTIPVRAGWNLVGSIDRPVAVGSVVANPPSLIGSAFFGYNGAYVVADSIDPGQGYWLKARTAGELVLSSGAPAALGREVRPGAALDGMSQLRISDGPSGGQTLYFGPEREGVNQEMFELPPPAPGADFAASFNSRRMLATHPKNLEKPVEIPLSIGAASSKIFFTWTVDNEKKFMYILVKKERGVVVAEYPLIDEGSQCVFRSGEAAFSLRVLQAAGSAGKPQIYSLGEMYPNPFNPATHFSFAVPSESFVSITVYSVLGDEVTSLIEGSYHPGTYGVEWNGRDRRGSTVSSGVYYIRMRAASLEPRGTRTEFGDVRKVVFIK